MRYGKLATSGRTVPYSLFIPSRVVSSKHAKITNLEIGKREFEFNDFGRYQARATTTGGGNEFFNSSNSPAIHSNEGFRNIRSPFQAFQIGLVIGNIMRAIDGRAPMPHMAVMCPTG